VAGAEVFGEKGCIRCHTISGSGESLGPDLREVASARTFEQLTAALWNHLPDMSRRMAEMGMQRPRLSDREAGDLFAYLYTLGYFDVAGDVERGETLFTDLNCIQCHQVGGIGGVVGPVLDHAGAARVPIEVAAAMWNHGPAMMAAAEARGIQRPRMTGRDLADLIAFIESGSTALPGDNLYVLPGNASAGAALIEERSCTECHGRPDAVDLAGSGRGMSLIEFVARMWNKAPAMMGALHARDLPYPLLEAEDFANLVAYLYSVNYFSEAGRAGIGRELVVSKGCERCHDANEWSTLRGLDHPSSITAALWNHLTVLEDGEVPATGWPSFTGREIGDLMAFFQASSP